MHAEETTTTSPPAATDWGFVAPTTLLPEGAPASPELEAEIARALAVCVEFCACAAAHSEAEASGLDERSPTEFKATVGDWLQAIERFDEAKNRLIHARVRSVAEQHSKVQAYRALNEVGYGRRQKPVTDDLIDLLERDADPENVLHALLMDLPGLKHGPTLGSDAWRRWAEALYAFVAAADEEQRLSQAADIATAAADAEAPIPEELKQPGGGAYLTESAVWHSPNLSTSKKERLAALVREWRPLWEAAQERHGATEANEAFEDYRGRDDAFENLIETPAPDLSALAAKLRAYIQRVYCGKDSQDIDTPDTIAEMLSENYDGGWAPTRIYQDILRLVGERPDIAEVQQFDAEGWLDAFTSIPGHGVAAEVGPTYKYPEAWPADRAADDAVRIHDQSFIAEYRAASKRLDPTYTADVDTSRGIEVGGPVCIAIVEAMNGFDEERAKLLVAMRSRLAGPVGRHLWHALSDWQQSLVLRAARRRAA